MGCMMGYKSESSCVSCVASLNLSLWLWLQAINICSYCSDNYCKIVISIRNVCLCVCIVLYCAHTHLHLSELNWEVKAAIIKVVYLIWKCRKFIPSQSCGQSNSFSLSTMAADFQVFRQRSFSGLSEIARDWISAFQDIRWVFCNFNYNFYWKVNCTNLLPTSTLWSNGDKTRWDDSLCWLPLTTQTTEKLSNVLV